MRDKDEELVHERGVGYVGLERVGRCLVMRLLRHCAISLDQYSSVGFYEVYTINGTGRELLGGD